MEWNTPIGQTKSCGGDALIRASAFQEVGGYDPTVIAGEEPEMCVRLRERAWTIHRIDAEMTLHDAAMTRAQQWWTRCIRGGHAYAQAVAMHGDPPENFCRREVRSIELWAMVPPILTFVLIVTIALFGYPRWCWLGVAPLLAYPAMMAKVAMWRRTLGDPWRHAVSYGISVVLGKFPQHLGVRKFRAAQRRGVRNTIIEYKHAARTGA
jgi:hypothetical protein